MPHDSLHSMITWYHVIPTAILQLRRLCHVTWISSHVSQRRVYQYCPPPFHLSTAWVTTSLVHRLYYFPTTTGIPSLNSFDLVTLLRTRVSGGVPRTRRATFDTTIKVKTRVLVEKSHIQRRSYCYVTVAVLVEGLSGISVEFFLVTLLRTVPSTKYSKFNKTEVEAPFLHNYRGLEPGRTKLGMLVRKRTSIYILAIERIEEGRCPKICSTKK